MKVFFHADAKIMYKSNIVQDCQYNATLDFIFWIAIDPVKDQ